MNLEEIQSLVQGQVSTRLEDLTRYDHDASIFKVRPEAVIKPVDVEDIKRIISFVNENKTSDSNLSITARAGGSDMSGGPLNDSIILDFTAHFNKIIEIGDNLSTQTGWIVVEPGVYYRDFEKETLKKNLFLPSYPASREICTVGGMVANNSGGEKSLVYGKTADYVQELNIVLSNSNEHTFKAINNQELEEKKSKNDFEGQLYRQMYELLENNYELIKNAKPQVSKNSAGYNLWDIWDRQKFDLTKLFAGSQGTLGLVTKIKFRLIKPKKYSELLAIFLKDLKSLGELVNQIKEFQPESLESYDDHTFRVAIKFLPDLIKQMKGSFLSMIFKFLPEIKMILTGGVPKLIILAEFTGDSKEELISKVNKCQKEVSGKFGVKTRIVRNSTEAQKYRIIRRESFNLLRRHFKNVQTAPFIDDVIVKPQDLPQFLPELNEILDQYKNLLYTIAGHPGDGNFHVIPILDLSKQENRRLIPEISDKVYSLVLKYHGSITAEHNDGLIRTPYLEKMYGPEVYNLFMRVKNIFDPQNIFNPHKKINGNTSHMINHIKF